MNSVHNQGWRLSINEPAVYPHLGLFAIVGLTMPGNWFPGTINMDHSGHESI
jgi:hypothetical protein